MFKNIKGHEAQIKALLENLNSGRLASAYLFSGPSGIGKKMIAMGLAKIINCLDASGDDSCGECPSCKKIEKGQHPDVFLVCAEAGKEDKKENPAPESDSRGAKKEASQVIKIEQIKEAEKRSYFRPYEAKYKVFIIDEAENMTAEASDALLKTLEEPPKDIIFILVSESEKMLASTIVSRCRRLRFNALSAEETKGALMADYYVDENKAHFLSYFSQGRISQALKIKDRDILAEKNLLIDDFLGKKIFFKNRVEARYKLNLFLAWLRDLLVLQLSARPVLINIDREHYLAKNKDKYTTEELKNCISFISEALFYLEANINLKLLTNLARIKLCKT